jgi:uncharacterized membrane protein
MAERQSENSKTNSNNSKALIGAGLAVAAGAATFLLARRSADMRDDGQDISDAPGYVFRDPSDPGSVGRTVTINRSAQELYEEWRDFERFPRFMENVRKVEKLDGKRSRWTIEAPLGATVELVTEITEDSPGRVIAWESEPDSQIETEGRVEFLDGAPGRGTMVRLTMRYSPPGGIVGKAFAKLFQREPDLQARRDLRRFKQLMETGEIPVNASPSARKSESPTEATI